MTSLRIGSLFSGIGGLDLGVEAASGGRTVWQVERDEWCRGVLARHWPDAVRFDDVCAVGEELEHVDIIVGGFPCQDVSLAGRRAGLEGQRSGLWREFARIVRVVRPRFVFVENVSGLLSLGLGDVLGDLAALGFDAEWTVLRASDAGAPHRRERVFILAMGDAAGARREGCAGESRAGARRISDVAVGAGKGVDHANGSRRGATAAREVRAGRHAAVGAGSAMAFPVCDRSLSGDAVASPCRSATEHGGASIGRGDRGLSAQPRLGGGADGIPCGLDSHRWPAGPDEAQGEWEPPRVAQGIPERRQRLKALGNAVVPQQAALAWRVLWTRMFGGVA